jgi:glutamyl/glutaminyl-tRNA synthetase
VKDEARFFQILNANVSVFGTFYEEQINNLLQQFHYLTAQAVRMVPEAKKKTDSEKGLIEEYIPQKKAAKSRLERELGRLNLATSISINGDDDFSKETDSPFFLITKSTWKELVNEKESKKVKLTKPELKHEFTELYRALILLQSYVSFNTEAIQKILKKHDKNVGLSTKDHYMESKVRVLSVYKHSKLSALVTEVEVAKLACTATHANLGHFCKHVH